jgi:hypothetical protein
LSEEETIDSASCYAVVSGRGQRHFQHRSGLSILQLANQGPDYSTERDGAMHEKRGVIEEGITPPETPEQREQLEQHLTKRAADVAAERCDGKGRPADGKHVSG